MAQFDRIARLTVGKPGADGVIIENLRIEFDIEKDTSETTNKSSVKVYNLAPNTRKILERPDTVCILEVGYREHMGLVRIFVGAVTHVTSRAEGPDMVTELELADGQVAVRDSVISIGYGQGVEGKQIARDVAAQMGLTLRMAPDVQFTGYPNGFAFAGYARDALTKVCSASGAQWSIQNNEIQIIMGGGTTSVRALVFSADSGLVGSPERIVKSPKKADKADSKKSKKKEDNKEKQAGWKVRTLLAPTVNPGDAVRVESKTVTGWFRVESLKHAGNTHGGTWLSEMELIEVKVSGEKPAS